MGMNFFEALAYTFKIINTIAPTILVIIGFVIVHVLIEICYDIKKIKSGKKEKLDDQEEE